MFTGLFFLSLFLFFRVYDSNANEEQESIWKLILFQSLYPPSSFTGCSLDIVVFFEDFKLFQTLFSLGVSVCTHTRKITIFNEHPVAVITNRRARGGTKLSVEVTVRLKRRLNGDSDNEDACIATFWEFSFYRQKNGR